MVGTYEEKYYVPSKDFEKEELEIKEVNSAAIL